jgi:hypothetical protein
MLDKEVLSTLYVRQGGRCYYTRVALDIHNFGRLQTASLQRLDSTKLHCVHTNIVLVCAAINEIDRTAVSFDPAVAAQWGMMAGANTRRLPTWHK